MIHSEIALGGCEGGCGVGKDTCFVRKLQKKRLTQVPPSIRETLEKLHSFAELSALEESLVISSDLWQGRSIIGELVGIYKGRVSDLAITIGDTDREECEEFYNTSLETLSSNLNQNGAVILGFQHKEDKETEISIFKHFDTALETLIKTRGKIKKGKILGVGLGKNNSRDVKLWVNCYHRLLSAIDGDRKTGHKDLDNTITKLRENIISVDDRGFSGGKIQGETGINHFLYLGQNLDSQLLIVLQVLPAVAQSTRVSKASNGVIAPLITPTFVAPFHNTYAMNASKNRISHELYQRILAEITGAEDAVEVYNQRFLTVLSANS